MSAEVAFRAGLPPSRSDLDERLSLLGTCQEMFARVKSFDELTGLEWKAIAGVVGEKQKFGGGLANHEWGYFGSMKGMGDFFE